MLWKLVGNWQQKRTGPFGIGVTLACLQQAWKLPRRTSRRNTALRRGAITSAVLLRKRGNIPIGSVPPYGSKSNKRRLTSLDLNAKVGEKKRKYAKHREYGRGVSYRKIGLTSCLAETQDLHPGMTSVLIINKNSSTSNSILPEPGQPSPQLS